MFGKSISGLLVVIVAIFGTVGMKKETTDTNVITFTKDNLIILRGKVSDESISPLVRQLQIRGDDPVYLFIHSPGGSVTAGNLLVDAIKGHKGRVTCYASEAISMAFVIFEACHSRYVSQYSILMQHEASYSVEGPAPNNLTFITFLHGMLKKMDQEQADRIGITYEDFKKKTATDWWMDGVDAVSNNVADKVVQASCTKDLTESGVPQHIESMFMSLDVVWSGCPLVPYPVSIKSHQSDEHKREFVKQLSEFYESYSAYITDSKTLRDLLDKSFTRIR